MTATATRALMPARNRVPQVTARPRQIASSAARGESSRAMTHAGHCACGGSCPKCKGAASQRDHSEREADSVASHVLSLPTSPAQLRDRMRGTSSVTLQGEKPKIKKQGGDADAGREAATDLSGRLSSGAPLDTAARNYFEPRFNHDFSNVRIHHGTEAAAVADEVHARALTVGRDVVFAAGQYDPKSDSGLHLLAHELTHVVQQSSGGKRLQMQPALPAQAPAPMSTGTEADVRGLVNDVIHMFDSSLDYFRLAQVSSTVLERVLTSWARMGTIYPDLIQTRLNNDAALLQRFKDAYKTALTVLLTRASSVIPNTSVIQLYLENLYRLPEWARPDVARLGLTTDVQRRAFITSLTSAFNTASLFQGHSTIDDATLQSLLRYLQTLITDSQNLLADKLGNDATLVPSLRDSYRTAVDMLLNRASMTTGQTVQDLFMRYRYGAPALIHEWADRELAGISAAVPLGVSADPLTGNIGIALNGFQVEIQPDGRQAGSGAMTVCNMQFTQIIGHNWDGRGIVTSFTAPTTPSITIRTDYGPGASATVASGYGRGTTAEDVRLGNTTLGYHEKTHSRDFLSFIHNNPAPTFTGAVGMTRKQFDAAVAQYVLDMNDYSARINRQSELATDCVGSPNIVQFHTNAGTVTTVACP